MSNIRRVQFQATRELEQLILTEAPLPDEVRESGLTPRQATLLWQHDVMDATAYLDQAPENRAALASLGREAIGDTAWLVDSAADDMGREGEPPHRVVSGLYGSFGLTRFAKLSDEGRKELRERFGSPIGDEWLRYSGRRNRVRWTGAARSLIDDALEEGRGCPALWVRTSDPTRRGPVMKTVWETYVERVHESRLADDETGNT
jgi:hypothetical protein